MDDKGKVISIRTRQAVPPVMPAPTEEADVPDQIQVFDADTVASLESFAEETRAGRYSGCLVLCWDHQQRRYVSELVLPEDDRPDITASILLAHMEVHKQALTDIIASELAELDHEQ